MIPSSRPSATREKIETFAAAEWNKVIAKLSNKQMPPVYLVGVRGYYRDSMGKAGANDRGIYDDAIFVVGPEAFVAFNANTDPTAWRPGVASLRTGVHPYKPGNHGISKPGGGYPAFRPATPNEELPVNRDGEKNPRPGVAINIHRGGINTTSSLGCQTIPPAQWEAFHTLLKSELIKADQRQFPYILIDGPIP